ncbi:MAG: type II toxin-antitoxin system RelE/ParE family toxin [Magnetococcales bacterium]|nr:type II toxin-antitoxin system RelE/ParE family toxin [Magnetococcales bacterium]
MRFEVLMTHGARRDLEELHDYIARHDSAEKAAHVLDAVLGIVETLAEFPKRGAHPRELHALGIEEFREIGFKPYRVIYRIQGQRVYILLVADGRRDFQNLLKSRFLRAWDRHVMS